MVENKQMQIGIELGAFVRNHERIYIYGAGMYGHCCEKYIECVDKNKFAGYMTSSGETVQDGTKTYKADELLPSLSVNDGIILAMKSLYQNQVISNITFKCDCLCVPDIFWAETDIITAKLMMDDNVFSTKYEGDELKRILIVQLEVTFGDIIWSSGFVRELKRVYSNSKIDYVINDKHSILVENCPYIDEIFVYSKIERWRILSDEMLIDIKQFYTEELERKEYDAVYLPRLVPCSIGDMWENILLMNLVKSKYRFGHIRCTCENEERRAQLFESLFTGVIKENEIKHNAFYNTQMLNLTGERCNEYRMELWLGKDYKNINKFVMDKRYIILGLCGSTPNRMWRPENFLNLIKMFENERDSYQFVILGGTESLEGAKVIEKGSNCCVNLVGKTTLIEAASIIQQSRMYVGVDTGLMQMASAAGVPIVEISHVFEVIPSFFSGAAERTGPWQVKNRILKPKRGLDGCQYLCKRYSHCINQITPEEVYNAIKQLLT